MDDTDPRLQRLADRVDAGWSERRHELVRARVHEGMASAGARGRAIAVVAVVASLLAGAGVATAWTVVQRSRARTGAAARARAVVRVANEPPLPAPMPAIVAAAPAPSAEPQPTTKPWRQLARSGQNHRAYRALAAGGPEAVTDEPADLMLAADVARLSGHPREAANHLQRLVQRHPRDALAPAASFTQGRLLLEQLSNPAEAAHAFAATRALAPSGALAADALAREADAWASARRANDAEERAREYLRLYPTGAAVARMRRLLAR